jgi:CubicO group peptidase (beta-lactamase class C family)
LKISGFSRLAAAIFVSLNLLHLPISTSHLRAELMNAVLRDWSEACLGRTAGHRLVPAFGIPMTKISRSQFHRHTTVCAAFIALFSLSVGAQDASSVSENVSKYVRNEMQRQHIPGLALLVARGGTILQAEGFGLANVELQVPVKPETVFQSGSVGKQFTATAVMMLMEEGEVGLDDPLTKYFADAPASWKDVTVRELLSHTAGFGDYPEKFDFRKDWTEDEELKLVESIPLAYPPGTKWEYSNLGYLTLGVLIHRVTGEFYGDFLRQRIFQPLGMQTTRIISEADIVPNRAAGYRLLKGELKNQEWVAPTVNTTADGSLYFSLLDLAKWDAALYTEKLLKRSSFEQMWTPAKLKNGQPNKDGYGFGWFIEERHGHRVISHDGAWQGFETNITRYVNDQLTVVVLTNLAGAKLDGIADHVADLYFAEGKHPAER